MGCIFSGSFSAPIGKRRAMQIVNLPIIASWLLFHFATSTEHLYAALCLCGLSGGLMEAPVLTFVAEICEPKYRGILSALGSACVISGVFVMFIMGSLWDWRTIAAVSTAFPVICIIALCFIPESPVWLISRHKYPEGVKALQWLRGWVPEHMVEGEFNSLYDQLITKPAKEEAEEKVDKMTKTQQFLHMFKKQTFWMPFLLVTLTFFIGHFSGKTTLQTYAVQIFHTLKAPINKYHATILLGLADLTATILCVFLIHFTGKRKLVLVSVVGCSVCMFGTATYAYFLNIVPGFAINNVVVNASSSISQDSIITKDNITRIFDTQEKAYILGEKIDYITTILPDFLEDTTLAKDIFLSRGEREATDAPPLEMSTVSSYEDERIEPVEKEIKEILLETKDQEHKIIIPVPKQKKNKLLWVPLVMLLSFAFFAHLGIRLIPWVLIGEVFPVSIRSTASGLVAGLGYLFGFLANKLFLQMLTVLTMPGTFWLYSAVAMIGAVLLYFYLPETEGKSLAVSIINFPLIKFVTNFQISQQEIEEHFSKKSSYRLSNSVRRKSTKKEEIELPYSPAPLQLDNLQIPMDKSKVLQLQQSAIMREKNRIYEGGRSNPAFEEDSKKNTTHL